MSLQRINCFYFHSVSDAGDECPHLCLLITPSPPSPAPPSLPASLHSHMSSVNTMLSGFLASWCLCLPHELWLKTNVSVCVLVEDQCLLLTGSVKTFCSGLLTLCLCTVSSTSALCELIQHLHKTVQLVCRKEKGGKKKIPPSV